MLRFSFLLWWLIPFFLVAQESPTTTPSNMTSMETWTYPYAVKKQRISDSIEVAYVDEGEGAETLIFIHGLGSNLKGWQKNINHLKDTYRCIALDLPGYGKSSKGDYPYDMHFFAESIKALVDSLALSSATLIGHSMGGQITLTIAQDPPAWLNKMVLLAPAGFEVFSESERQWFGQVSTPDVIRNLTEEQIRMNFNLNFFSFPEDANFMIEDRLLLRSTVEYDQFCHMIPACVQGMLLQPVFDTLPKIQTPALVIFGKEDALIPNKYLHPELTIDRVAEQGGNRMPNAQTELLSPAGHFVQWEQYTAVNQLIRDFLPAE